MSIDLNFWKYQKDICLDNAAVYQKACCDNEKMEGLEVLPIEDILKEVANAFPGWNPLDRFTYESKEHGSFQISTTPQTVRFDCSSMVQADMKRFSAIMSKFGCPLYDPQQGVRFDIIDVFLIDEAGGYQPEAEEEISRLLPHFKIKTQTATWAEYERLSKTLPHVNYSAIIHRAKTITKVTSFMAFGNAWANRPCQCKTAQLEDSEKAHALLAELLKKSIGRVVGDFLERTYYG